MARGLYANRYQNPDIIIPQAWPVASPNIYPNFQNAPVTIPDLGPAWLWASGKIQEHKKETEIAERLAAQSAFLDLEKQAKSQGQTLNKVLRDYKLPESASIAYQEEVYGLIGDRIGREEEAKYLDYYTEATSLKGAHATEPDFGSIYKRASVESEQQPVLTNPYAAAAYQRRVLAARAEFEGRVAQGRADEFIAANKEELSSLFSRDVLRYAMRGSSKDEETAAHEKGVLETALTLWQDKARAYGTRDVRAIAIAGIAQAVDGMDPNQAHEVLEQLRTMRISKEVGFFKDDPAALEELRKIEDNVFYRARYRDQLYDEGPRRARKIVEGMYPDMLKAAVQGKDVKAVAFKLLEEVQKTPDWKPEWIDDTVKQINDKVGDIRELRPDPSEDGHLVRSTIRDLEAKILALDPQAEAAIEAAGPVIGTRESFRLSTELASMRSGQLFALKAGLPAAQEKLARVARTIKAPGVQLEAQELITAFTDSINEAAGAGPGSEGFNPVAFTGELRTKVYNESKALAATLANLAKTSDEKRLALRTKAEGAIAGFQTTREMLDAPEAKRLLDPTEWGRLVKRGDDAGNPLNGTGYSDPRELSQKLEREFEGTPAAGFGAQAAARILNVWQKDPSFQDAKKKGAGENDSIKSKLSMDFELLRKKEAQKILSEIEKDQAAEAIIKEKPNSPSVKSLLAAEQATAAPGRRLRVVRRDMAALEEGVRLPHYATKPSVLLDAFRSEQTEERRAELSDALVDLFRVRTRDVFTWPPFGPSTDSQVIDLASQVVSARGVTPKELEQGFIEVEYSPARLRIARSVQEDIEGEMRGQARLLGWPADTPLEDVRWPPGMAPAPDLFRRLADARREQSEVFKIPLDGSGGNLYNPWNTPVLGWSSMSEQQKSSFTDRLGVGGLGVRFVGLQDRMAKDK